jgi:hypothetical protein
VAEVKYLAWTEDNLLRQVVYEGLREDKPATEVRCSVPQAKNSSVRKLYPEEVDLSLKSSGVLSGERTGQLLLA